MQARAILKWLTRLCMPLERSVDKILVARMANLPDANAYSIVELCWC